MRPAEQPNPRPPTRPGHDAAAPVVLHSTWTGLVASVFTPGLLIAIGMAALTTNGARPVPVALVAIGVLLGATAALRLPRSTRLDEAGITQVCLLARRQLTWAQVTAIARTPPRAAERLRRARDARQFAPEGPGPDPHDPAADISTARSGGLIAITSRRRRWLLADQIESQREYDAIAALLRHVTDAPALRASRPAPGVPPTDLYRRRRG